MTDEPPKTDGGSPASAERDVRRAGDRPPDVPARTTIEDLLPRLLEDVDEVSTGFHIRARLAGDDPGVAAEQLVEALERKVTVVGTTLDAGLDPADPQLDVLIECEHTMSQVATALARVAPVEGAVVLDVTAECEHALEDQEESEEADAASANDVFNELQEQVGQADYDQVVDELEDVSFPGGPDPDEEVDLAEETGVELDADIEGGSTSDREPDLDPDRETIDLDNDEGMDPEEVSAAELFGEADDEDEEGPTQVGSEADETAIEEAVANVEEQFDDPEVDDTEEPATADDSPETATTDGPAGTADPDEPTVTDSGPAPDEPEPAAGAEASEADEGEPGPAAPEGPTEGPEPAAGDDAAAASARTDGSAAPAEGGEVQVDATVDALVRALESGDIGPDRRQRLREALGIESNHSIDVRLEYLQKRVDNLAAYNDAWEAFLSEEGTGNQFIEEVRDRLDDLEGQVESGTGGADPELVERVDALEGTVEQLAAEQRLAAVEDRLADLESRHEDLAERHDEDVSRIEGRLETFGDAIEKLKESLQQFADWRASVNEVLRG